MLTRRKFLLNSAKTAAALTLENSIHGGTPSFGATSNPPFVLQIHCAGGWDPSIIFDPKISVDTLPKETGSRIITAGKSLTYAKHSSRPSVDAFFRDYSDRSAIINGLSCLSMNHENATRRVLGNLDPQTKRTTDWLTYYAYMMEPFATFPHLIFDTPIIAGPLSQYVYRLATSDLGEMTAPSTSIYTNETKGRIQAFIKSKYGKLSDLHRSNSPSSEKIDTIYAGYLKNLTGPSAIRNASLSVAAANPTADGFKRNALIAIELFKNRKARCATVQMGNGALWDTHQNNFALQSLNFESLFSALNEIMSYAKTAGIIDNLLLIVTSEMGRSPYLNDKSGKDHWPFTSVLVSGPGITNGATVGQTDNYLRGQKINPIFGNLGDTLISMSNVWAAIYLRLGVPYSSFISEEVLPLATIIKS